MDDGGTFEEQRRSAIPSNLLGKKLGKDGGKVRCAIRWGVEEKVPYRVVGLFLVITTGGRAPTSDALGRTSGGNDVKSLRMSQGVLQKKMCGWENWAGVPKQKKKGVNFEAILLVAKM